MGNERKREFLTVHDYGTGGIWMLINARNTYEVKEKWPDFTAFEDRPDWMSESEKERYCSKLEKRVSFGTLMRSQQVGSGATATIFNNRVEGDVRTSRALRWR